MLAIHDGQYLQGVNETQRLPSRCPDAHVPSAVRIVALSFREVAQLTATAGLKVDIAPVQRLILNKAPHVDVRKVADLKPMSGFLAHAAIGLDNYTHWACSEIDLMLGTKLRWHLTTEPAIMNINHVAAWNPPTHLPSMDNFWSFLILSMGVCCGLTRVGW